VYLSLPQARERSTRVAGLILGAAAIIGTLMLLGTRVMGASSTNVFFYVFAGLAVFTAARVATHRKPVYSAVYFVAVVVCVAALLILEEAQFLAIALIIIYAGAILVTYAFVIMLAQQAGESVVDTRAREPFVGVLIGFVAMAAVAGRIADPKPFGPLPEADTAVTRASDSGPSVGAAGIESKGAGANVVSELALTDEGNTVHIGRSVMGPYVVVVQLAGVLLLVALIGAMALVRRRVPPGELPEERIEIGRVGKTVPPF
jgi:NADH-quinone oxidoreductase subunit J